MSTILGRVVCDEELKPRLRLRLGLRLGKRCGSARMTHFGDSRASLELASNDRNAPPFPSLAPQGQTAGNSSNTIANDKSDVVALAGRHGRDARRDGISAKVPASLILAEDSFDFGAGARSRTGTGLSAQQILSLVRLPVPPRPRDALFRALGPKRQACDPVLPAGRPKARITI